MPPESSRFGNERPQVQGRELGTAATVFWSATVDDSSAPDGKVGADALATLAELRAGSYYDSVVLMLLQRALAGLPGILDAGVVMGTPAKACRPAYC